jgi:KTSC domain
VPSFLSPRAIVRLYYDAHLRQLHIWFHASPDDHYTYFGVPFLIYEQLLEAPSRDRYVAAYIHSRYGYMRR